MGRNRSATTWYNCSASNRRTRWCSPKRRCSTCSNTPSPTSFVPTNAAQLVNGTLAHPARKCHSTPSPQVSVTTRPTATAGRSATPPPSHRRSCEKSSHGVGTGTTVTVVGRSAASRMGRPSLRAISKSARSSATKTPRVTSPPARRYASDRIPMFGPMQTNGMPKPAAAWLNESRNCSITPSNHPHHHFGVTDSAPPTITASVPARPIRCRTHDGGIAPSASVIRIHSPVAMSMPCARPRALPSRPRSGNVAVCNTTVCACTAANRSSSAPVSSVERSFTSTNCSLSAG